MFVEGPFTCVIKGHALLWRGLFGNKDGNNASFYFGSQWLTCSPGAMNQRFLLGVGVVKLLLKMYLVHTFERKTC